MFSQIGQLFLPETAPRQLLLHCSNKLHPCDDAFPALPLSLVVVCLLRKRVWKISTPCKPVGYMAG